MLTKKKTVVIIHSDTYHQKIDTSLTQNMLPFLPRDGTNIYQKQIQQTLQKNILTEEHRNKQSYKSVLPHHNSNHTSEYINKTSPFDLLSTITVHQLTNQQYFSPKYYMKILTLILRRSRTGTVWFYTSTSNKRAARPKLYTKSLTRDLKLMYSRLTLVTISINLQAPRFFYIGTGVSLLFRESFVYS